MSTNLATQTNTNSLRSPANLDAKGTRISLQGDFFPSSDSEFSPEDSTLWQNLQELKPAPAQESPGTKSNTEEGWSMGNFERIVTPREPPPVMDLSGTGQQQRLLDDPGGRMALENSIIGADDESSLGSVSVGFPGRGSVGHQVQNSGGQSMSSVGSSNWSFKRWGYEYRMKNKAKGYSQAPSVGSNPDPVVDDKENPSPFVLTLPTGHNADCEEASEKFQALIRTISAKQSAESNNTGLPSPGTPKAPGVWFDRLWTRKEVEKLDKDIVMGLNDVGIATEEYFKRDFTTFPSIAHYYVNLHHRLNERDDDELVDLVASLEQRIGETHPLVQAIHEVIQHENVPSANYSDALFIDVSSYDRNGGSRAYVTYPQEGSILEVEPNSIIEEDADIDPDGHGHCPKNDSMQIDTDFVPMVPEMNHMRRELAGLSWVVKRPSQRLLSIPPVNHQHTSSIVEQQPSEHYTSSGDESMSTEDIRPAHETTAASVSLHGSRTHDPEFDLYFPPADSGAIQHKPQVPPRRPGLFACCFRITN